MEYFIEHKPLFLKSALMLLYLLEEIEVLPKFLSHFNICYIWNLITHITTLVVSVVILNSFQKLNSDHTSVYLGAEMR